MAAQLNTAVWRICLFTQFLQINTKRHIQLGHTGLASKLNISSNTFIYTVPVCHHYIPKMLHRFTQYNCSPPPKKKNRKRLNGQRRTLENHRRKTEESMTNDGFLVCITLRTALGGLDSCPASKASRALRPLKVGQCVQCDGWFPGTRECPNKGLCVNALWVALKTLYNWQTNGSEIKEVR